MDLLVCLQIILIILKALDKIDWSWYKVLIPLWIYLGLCVIILFSGGCVLYAAMNCLYYCY